MRKPHEHAQQERRSDQVETREAVDAAIEFSRTRRDAIWDELLTRGSTGECREPQSCTVSLTPD
jgi:hypothetical protein